MLTPISASVMANKAFKFRRIGFGCSLFSVLVCAASCVWNTPLWNHDPAANLARISSRDTVSVKSNAKKLEEILELIRRKYRRPALAAAIVNEDSIIAIGAVGVRKVGARQKITLEDRFHLGSCTKAMTATLIAMLVEEGKLSWQTTISEVFPDLKDKILPQYREVTVEQLLYHRSGLPVDRRPNLKNFKILLQLRTFRGPIDEQRRRLVKLVLRQKPTATPGSKMQYSNFGYAIVGAMAEASTGKSWEGLLTERLFKPLNMTTAGFGVPGNDIIVDQPWGHRRMFGFFIPMAIDNPAVIGPAGTVHCSISDFARFAWFHLRGARANATLLQADSFQKMHNDPYGQGYAMGWVVKARDRIDSRTLLHAGTNTCFYAVIYIVPEKNFAMVITTNSGDPLASTTCSETIEKLIEAFFVSPRSLDN